METFPPPLTPPECDLRGMPYLPVDIVRLLDSDFYALATGDEFKAGFTLWARAFLQKPAGSLPDDERILEHLAGTKKWRTVRKVALHGWIKCADGRLYHPVVAEKAREAWAGRVARREQTAAARAARHKKSPTPETFDETDEATTSVTENETSSKYKCKSKLKESSDSAFESFWAAYPRKTGKGAARKAFTGARLKAAADTILAGEARAKWPADPQFIPHPATWLNREGWLDEPSPATAPAEKGTFF